MKNGYKKTKALDGLKGVVNSDILGYLSGLEKVSKLNGVQARAPFEIEIK